MVAIAQPVYTNASSSVDILLMEKRSPATRRARVRSFVGIEKLKIIPRKFRGTKNKAKDLVPSNGEQNRKSAGHRREVYSSVASHSLQSRLLSVASRDDV